MFGIGSTKETDNMTKLYLQKPGDIPFQWKTFTARKKTTVRIRPCLPEGESFKVSWSDSRLYATKEEDVIVIQPNGKEYPCKRDIFAATYTTVEKFGEHDSIWDYTWIKSATSTLVEIPQGYDITVGTLEGDVSDVRYPDFIVIGAKGELYVNTKKTVEEHLEIIP